MDPAEYEALSRLAEADGLSVEAIVRRAANLYLARRCGHRRPSQDGLTTVLAEIATKALPDLTPDEIEVEARAAREEVRQLRRAAR